MRTGYETVQYEVARLKVALFGMAIVSPSQPRSIMVGRIAATLGLCVSIRNEMHETHP